MFMRLDRLIAPLAREIPSLIEERRRGLHRLATLPAGPDRDALQARLAAIETRLASLAPGVEVRAVGGLDR